MHVVAVHGRNDAVADIVDENESAKGTHGHCVGIRAHAHGGHCASLTADQVLLVVDVVLRPQVVHEEGTFLRRGTDQVRPIRVRCQEIQAPCDFVS